MRSSRVLALVLAALTGSLSAGIFTGSIRYRLTDPRGGTHNLTLSIDGSKVRTDMRIGKDGRSTSIIDLDAKTLTTLWPQRKTYMVMDYAALMAKAKAQDAGPVRVVKTGASARIAGYKADEWTLTRGGKVSSVWLTSQLGRGFFGHAGPAGLSLPNAWKGKDLLMLRLTQPGGMKMEATKVDTHTPSAALFRIPHGYTKMAGGMGAAGFGGGAAGMAAERMRAAMRSMNPAQRAAMQKMMNLGAGR